MVFIHCSFPSPVGGMMNGLARFAVPLFFMVSGYFSFGRGMDTVRRRLGNTFRVFLAANIVYFLWDLFVMYRDGALTAAAVGELFTPKAMGEFLVLNQSPFMYHLWFLGALLYCYLFYGLLVRFGKEESVYFLIPVCLTVNLILGEGFGILDWDIPVAYMRNFWVTGLPFFLWGHWFAREQKAERLHIRTELCLLAMGAGACLSMGEMLLSGGAELYFGSILLTAGIFAVAVRNPSWGRGRIIARVGERDSQHIYLWQVIVYSLMSSLANSLGISGHKLYEWLMPLAVCLASWMLAEILERSKRYEKRRVG